MNLQCTTALYYFDKEFVVAVNATASKYVVCAAKGPPFMEFLVLCCIRFQYYVDLCIVCQGGC
jgi:hypothetical protein